MFIPFLKSGSDEQNKRKRKLSTSQITYHEEEKERKT